MKTLHVTHQDLDGLIPLLINKYFNIHYDEVLTMDYKYYEEEDFDYEYILGFDEITFSDFSPNDVLLEGIIERGIKLTLIDHHKTGLETFNKFKSQLEALENKDQIEIYFDNSKSGGKLYFEYMKDKYPNIKITKGLEELVHYADEYDLYKTDSPTWEMSLNLNRLLWQNFGWAYSKGMSPKKFDRYLSLIEPKAYLDEPISFTMYERNALANAKSKEEDAYKKAVSKMLFRTDERGNKFAIVRLRSKVSIVAHNILKNFKDLTYCVLINEFNKGELKISCRARDGFNLLELNGCAGHKLACGVKGISQRFIEQLWRGQSIYELGYNPDFIDEGDEPLEKVFKIY